MTFPFWEGQGRGVPKGGARFAPFGAKFHNFFIYFCLFSTFSPIFKMKWPKSEEWKCGPLLKKVLATPVRRTMSCNVLGMAQIDIFFDKKTFI